MSEAFSQSTGKKKTSVASVRLVQSKSPSFIINNRQALEYFQGQNLLVQLALQAFGISGIDSNSYSISVSAHGGGLSSQSYAIRLAIAKILAKFAADVKIVIKSAGLLTRDSRIVERKKVGLRKARKKEQYSKR
jgi:small subunit ribosomal protein S9